MAIDSEQLATGIRRHQQGQLEEAHAIYRQLLAEEPENPAVLNLLGAVCINRGRHDEAAAHLAAALRIDPDNAAARDNLGVLLVKQGRTGEAIVEFRRATELNPNHAQTYLNLAAALKRNAQHDEAIEAFRTAARLAPQSLRAQSEAARALAAQGRTVESVPFFRQRARLKQEDARARFELAAALAGAGQTSEAIAAYRETLELKPDSAESCVNLASLYIERKDYDEAIRWASRAIAMRPGFAEAHLNLGCALSRQHKLDEARDALGEAIRLKPGLSQAYNNLGTTLAEADRFEEAIAQYRLALAREPAGADAWYNWGLAELGRGDAAAAVERFDRALALKPNYAEAHHNRASALLLSGKLDEGLPEYEWRFRSRDFPPFRARWKPFDGDDWAGRTIVLVAEQGLGDTLQFVRYAALLAARGARVMVECAASLHPLLAQTPGVSRWIGPDDPAPEADGCVPLMSMPYRLRTTLASIPADVAYIFADERRRAAWRQRLAPIDALKVGIVWQGNPRCPGDRRRSIPLAEFAPLARVPGVRLISLQKGPGAEQLAALESGGIVDFGGELDASGGAFLDTAAIIRGLDLVITSDTAAAHLAGALGAEVWLALQCVPDWRWLLGRDDSPWYPTMRLFRQARLGDWRDVFARIAEALAERAEARQARH